MTRDVAAKQFKDLETTRGTPVEQSTPLVVPPPTHPLPQIAAHLHFRNPKHLNF